MPGFADLFKPSEWFRRTASTPGSAVDRSVRMVPRFSKGKGVRTPFDVFKYADEGYRRNVIVMACVQEVLSTVSEPVLVAEERKNGTVTALPDDHPLVRLLRRPNPDYSQNEMIERLALNGMIAGEWYLNKARDQYHALAELWPVRPDRMSPIPSHEGTDRGIVTHYELKNDTAGGKPDLISANNVIRCIITPDYLNEFGALPPMAAAAMWIDMDNESALFLQSFFENNAEPAGYLKFKGVTDRTERERARSIWNETHGRGTGNKTGWHSTAVLDSDVDYTKTGATPNQMRLDAIFDESESRICAAFGIHPVVIAVRIGLMSSTYSNYAEARTSMWEEKLLPMYARMAAKLTLGVASEYSDDIVIRFDTSQVKALQEDRTRRQMIALDAWETDLISRNEARVTLGWPALDTPDGLERKGKDVGGFGAFARTGHEHHRIAKHAGHGSTETLSRSRIKALMAAEFRRQGAALAEHVESELDATK